VGEAPKTEYVAVGDADVAYQVVGGGPLDVLYFYGLGSNVEALQLTPGFEEFLKRLSSFARVILFDRRGTGASDGVPRSAIPTVEEWTDDVLAVLDAAGSGRAAIIAAVDAGPVAVLFAAMHPERVRALMLINTAARFLRDEDYPVGASVEEIDALVAMLGATWGTVDFVHAANPGIEDPFFLENTARWARLAANPPGTGRPGQTCQNFSTTDGGNTGPQYPGHALSSPGSVFNEAGPGTGGFQYNLVGAFPVRRGVLPAILEPHVT
jgi:pimeloyl-ACP methyl ester carboxylesterase